MIAPPALPALPQLHCTGSAIFGIPCERHNPPLLPCSCGAIVTFMHVLTHGPAHFTMVPGEADPF